MKFIILLILLITINSIICYNMKIINNRYKYQSLKYCNMNDDDNIDSSVLDNMIRTDILTKAEEEMKKDDKKGDKTKTVKKSTKAKDLIIAARERSGFIFKKKGDPEEYDVPYIEDNPRWFRLSVRKTSEQSVADKFLDMKKEDRRWDKIIYDSFYPQSPYFTLTKGKVIMKGKPLVPGVVYVKTIMTPEIADAIENINGIYGFFKTPQQLILPLAEDEGLDLETVKITWENRKMDEDMARLKKDEYVSIVGGTHKGKYGILMGAKSGKLEVCIRNDGYKDDWDVFEASELRYLQEPPEKKWKEMTAKEAVESLMAKDPQNAYLRALKKAGLLKDILYPERSARDQNSDSRVSKKEWQNRGGAEGGKRIRSIAKDDQKELKQRKFDTWEPVDSNYIPTENRNSNRYDKDYSSRPNDVNSKSKTLDDDWDFVNTLFDDLESTGKSKANDKSNAKRSISTTGNNNNGSDKTAVKNDFNNLINNILDDMVKEKPNTDKKSNSDSNKLIQDFLKDLNTNTNTNNDKRIVSTKKKTVIDDDLDFDKLFGDLDDLDNVFSDNDNDNDGTVNSKNNKNNLDKSNSKNNNGNGNAKVPSMEDYPTFEAYLDALVSYERTYSSPRNSSIRKNNVVNKMNDSNKKKNNNDNDDDLIDTVLEDLGLNTTPKKVYNNVKNTKTTITNIDTESNNNNDNKDIKTKTNDSLESLTLKDLKAKAKEMGLPISGRKDELIERIQSKSN